MTTGYRDDVATGAGAASVDFEALDDLFDGGNGNVATREHVVRPQAIVPSAASRQEVISPLDGQASSAPDSTVGAIRRELRTLAPFVISDVISLVLAGLVTYFVLLFVYPAAAQQVGRAAPLALLPLLVAYWLGGLYAEIWVHPVVEFRQFTHITTVCLLAAAAGGSLAWPFPIWCFVAWPVCATLVPMLRTYARHLCVDREWWGYPTLVIGSGDRANELARMLLDVPRSGLRPMLVTDPEGNCRTAMLPVVNDHATLESLLRAEGIRHAVVSLPEFSSARLTELLDRYGGLLPHLLVLSDTSTLPSLWGASRNCGRLSGIEVRNDLLLATLQQIKRALDVTVCATVLLLGAPVLALICWFVRRSGPGPIFYGHTRIGRNGKPFTAWKFRTMHQNGDEILAKHLESNAEAREEWERDHKLRDDPRVTGIGRLLRMTSLDELPQVWNVLVGEMALVGPRPIVEDEVRRYGDVFRLYQTVKPGITGLWQVSGRTNLSYDDRVLLDQFYIRHWSPWLDIYILAKTVVALVNREGAY